MKKFAHVSRVKAGTILVADGGFTCLKEGAKRKVHEDKNTGELWVKCSCGQHELSGQLGYRPDVVNRYVGFCHG